MTAMLPWSWRSPAAGVRFGARSAIYRKIIVNLLKGSASLIDLLTAAAKTKTGDYSEYLNDMVTAGFLARDYTWKPASGELSKLSHYRYRRFR
jgi:hypothetical protein